jgi:Flp pilus assembly protein TadG
MKKILDKYRNSEDGAGELYSALVVIPILLILLVAIIDVGGYYLAMGKVADIAKEGSRQVAIYGGSDSTLAKTKLGQPVSTYLRGLLYNGSCTQSRCVTPPTVTCTGTAGIKPGTMVNCTVDYYYDSILGSAIGTAAGTLDFGLSTFLETKKTIIQYSVAETWSN